MAEKVFRVLTIRSAGATAQSALYPLLYSNRKGEIAWEDLDQGRPGQQRPDQERPDEERPGQTLTVRYCRASAVTVSRIIDGAELPIFRLRGLRFDVYVTAGRLVLACRRYSTASALEVAGPGAAFGAGGVIRAPARRRMQGAAMVGHIRYPWIRSITPLPRKRWYGRDALIIEFAVSPQVPMLLRLDLRLPPRGPERAKEPEEAAKEPPPDVSLTEEAAGLTPIAVMAKEIRSRVVKYWDDYASPKQKAKFGLTGVGGAQLNPSLAGIYEFPAWYPVTAAVPFLERDRRSMDPYPDDKAGAE